MQPYITINIQTTGLISDEWKAPRILSLAMVYDDLKTPIAELPHLYLKIDWSDVDDALWFSSYSEEHLKKLTLQLEEFNRTGKDLITTKDKLADRNVNYCKSKLAITMFNEFLAPYIKDRSTIRFCGNSSSNFILYSLCYNNFLKNSDLYGDNRIIHHNPYDVANFFVNDKARRFAYYEEAVEALLGQTGLDRDSESRHHALLNALNLVRLTRMKLNDEIHSFSF